MDGTCHVRAVLPRILTSSMKTYNRYSNEIVLYFFLDKHLFYSDCFDLGKSNFYDTLLTCDLSRTSKLLNVFVVVNSIILLWQTAAVKWKSRIFFDTRNVAILHMRVDECGPK